MKIDLLLEPFLPFMIRLIVGILFLFQAYDKLLRVGLKETFEAIHETYKVYNIPKWFLKLSVTVSTYIELIAGSLLIIGLFKPIALLLLGINLIMVTVSFSFHKGIWNMQNVFPRLLLLIALFLIPMEWDVWTMDYLLNLR